MTMAQKLSWTTEMKTNPYKLGFYKKYEMFV